MGAATGQPACVASTIRICLHYGNLDVLEDGYGINMLPLATFALETYGDDPCECFAAKGGEDSGNSQQMLERRMHKAITVMQLKLENRLIRENPEYGMENRRLLERSITRTERWRWGENVCSARQELSDDRPGASGRADRKRGRSAR